MHLRRRKKMQRRSLALVLRLFGCLTLVSTLFAQEPCRVASPTATFSIPYAKTGDRLDTDPKSSFWSKASSAWILKDCSRELDYPELRTEVRGLWTDTHLYFLFACPYRKLNVFLPAQNDRPRDKLWDRDVVEMFLGDDWKNIRHYREFEIAPTGDWIDLAINLDSKSYDQHWRSGWQVRARIDEPAHRWFAAARIPLKSVSDAPVQAGTRWRMNLYRIEGEGPDSQRHFCAGNPPASSIAIPIMFPRPLGLWCLKNDLRRFRERKGRLVFRWRLRTVRFPRRPQVRRQLVSLLEFVAGFFLLSCLQECQPQIVVCFRVVRLEA